MKAVKLYQYAGIIPARYASSRFPGKPLVMIGNKTMIQRVYEQAAKVLDLVYVATDDKKIEKCVTDFGGNVVMTSDEHMSGTDRCAEAYALIEMETGKKIDVVINIQGDEPFIKPEQINLLLKCFNDEKTEIATLVKKCEPGEDIFNPNQPKVIINSNGDAMYFSRAAIPYFRDLKQTEWSNKNTYFKHIGLYGYRTDTLKKITCLSRSPLEIAENLEQNRWLENGFQIKTAITVWESIGIDTPADLENARLILNESF